MHRHCNAEHNVDWHRDSRRTCCDGQRHPHQKRKADTVVQLCAKLALIRCIKKNARYKGTSNTRGGEDREKKIMTRITKESRINKQVQHCTVITSYFETEHENVPWIQARHRARDPAVIRRVNKQDLSWCVSEKRYHTQHFVATSGRCPCGADLPYVHSRGGQTTAHETLDTSGRVTAIICFTRFTTNISSD